MDFKKAFGFLIAGGALLGCSLLPTEQIGQLAEQGQAAVGTAQAIATEAAAAEQETSEGANTAVESSTSAEAAEAEAEAAPVDQAAVEEEAAMEEAPAEEDQANDAPAPEVQINEDGTPADSIVALDGSVEVPLPAGSTETFSAKSAEGTVAAYQTTELTTDEVETYFRDYFEANGYNLEGEMTISQMTTLIYTKDNQNVVVNIDASVEITQYQIVISQQ